MTKKMQTEIRRVEALSRAEWRDENKHLPKTRHGRCRNCLTPFESHGTDRIPGGFGISFVYCPVCSPQEEA